MNNQNTLEKMKQMKLYGMYEAFTTAIQSGMSNSLTQDQFIAQLVEHEHDDRKHRKYKRLVSNAKFRYNASLEDVIFSEHRNLNKLELLRLAECSFIDKAENVLITGSTGVGKSYLASALGYHACSLDYKVGYYNTSRLISSLKLARAAGTYLRETNKIQRMDLVILDDYGLQSLDKDARMILMDLIEDRHERKSTMITSQLPVASWYEIIGEKTHADAIMDRLTHHAHRIELEGESLRKKSNQNTLEINA
ncbi:ATP-binding protein [bacterium]|nr:ATP-binding protein [bacterium]